MIKSFTPVYWWQKIFLTGQRGRILSAVGRQWAVKLSAVLNSAETNLFLIWILLTTNYTHNSYFTILLIAKLVIFYFFFFLFRKALNHQNYEYLHQFPRVYKIPFYLRIRKPNDKKKLIFLVAPSWTVLSHFKLGISLCIRRSWLTTFCCE